MNILDMRRKCLGHVPMGGDPGGQGGGGNNDLSPSTTVSLSPQEAQAAIAEQQGMSNANTVGSITGPTSTSGADNTVTGYADVNDPSVDPEWGDLSTTMANAAVNPAAQMTPEETQNALNSMSDLAIQASNPNIPSNYYGSSMNYSTFSPGWQEALFDLTNPEPNGVLGTLGIKGMGMSTEQMLENETPEAQAARMEMVGRIMENIATAAMPSGASAAIALAKALESGQGIGGIVGGLIGSKSGIPMGGGIGSMIGRSIENNAPPSLDAIAGMVGSYAGGKVGGGWGAQMGGYLASRGMKDIMGNWGTTVDATSPKVESNVGGVSKGRTGNGGSEAGYNGWTGADVTGAPKGVMPIAVGGAR